MGQSARLAARGRSPAARPATHWSSPDSPRSPSPARPPSARRARSRPARAGSTVIFLTTPLLVGHRHRDGERVTDVVGPRVRLRDRRADRDVHVALDVAEVRREVAIGVVDGDRRGLAGRRVGGRVAARRGQCPAVARPVGGGHGGPRRTGGRRRSWCPATRSPGWRRPACRSSPLPACRRPRTSRMGRGRFTWRTLGTMTYPGFRTRTPERRETPGWGFPAFLGRIRSAAPRSVAAHHQRRAADRQVASRWGCASGRS